MFKILFPRFREKIRSLGSWYENSFYYDYWFPPSTPSGVDLYNYKRVLNDFLPASEQVLVLGVTPQLRRLLSGFSGKIIVADFSMAMYRKAKKMLPSEILKKESFLWIDWLNLKKAVPLLSFDLAVGDFVFTQINHKEREKFVDVIHSVLKPGGIFLTRVKIHNPMWVGIRPIEIIRKGFGSVVYKSSRIDPYLSYRLGDKILDTKTFSCETRDYTPLLKEALVEAGNDSEKFLILEALRFWSKVDATRSYLGRSFFEGLVKNKFEILDMLAAEDYEESEFCPIYVMRKKEVSDL